LKISRKWSNLEGLDQLEDQSKMVKPGRPRST
jgi:hypothetical protein